MSNKRKVLDRRFYNPYRFWEKVIAIHSIINEDKKEYWNRTGEARVIGREKMLATRGCDYWAYWLYFKDTKTVERLFDCDILWGAKDKRYYSDNEMVLIMEELESKKW